MMVDTRMPEIAAELLLLFYCRQSRGATKIKDLVENLSKKNPLSLSSRNLKATYEQRVKQLILDSALGMQPDTPWLGVNQANGGYLVLKQTGEVVCFYIYDHEHLKTYLIDNTRFETPDSQKHGFAKLYEENGKVFIKLNMQIRFL